MVFSSLTSVYKILPSCVFISQVPVSAHILSNDVLKLNPGHVQSSSDSITLLWVFPAVPTAPINIQQVYQCHYPKCEPLFVKVKVVKVWKMWTVCVTPYNCCALVTIVVCAKHYPCCLDSQKQCFDKEHIQLHQLGSSSLSLLHPLSLKQIFLLLRISWRLSIWQLTWQDTKHIHICRNGEHK